jgi:hypothetical protein
LQESDAIVAFNSYDASIRQQAQPVHTP